MKLLLLLGLFLTTPCLAAEMKLVPGGEYPSPLDKSKKIKISEFSIDEVPVTNKDFHLFIRQNPAWAKGRVKVIFADKNYLEHWLNATVSSKKEFDAVPVVNVSWFAAKAYCEWQNKRLPTVEEWEYLAQFGPEDKSGDVTKVILEWYSKPTPEKLPPIKSTFRNKFGVWDVHGLVWEWNEDFNTTFVTGESRGDSALEKAMFCGAGAVGVANPSDYALFMRFGFRSSLRANYTVGNLGFRCAKGGAP